MDNDEAARWTDPTPERSLRELTSIERQQIVLSIVSQHLNNVQAVTDGSLSYRLSKALVEAAYEHANSVNATLSEFENNFAWPACEIEAELRYALTNNLREKKLDSNNFWVHDSDIVENVRAGNEIIIWRSEVERVTERYLSLPYRVPVFERLLVDVLIATELHAFFIIAFGSEAKAAKRAGLISPSSMLRPHPLWTYTKGRIADLLLISTVVAVLVYSLWNWSQTINMWVIALGVLAFTISTAYATIFLPIVWLEHRKTFARLSEIIRHMNLTYHELQNSSVVSTRRLREIASRAADAGVGWPSSLFAVLDDNIRHGGQLPAPIFEVKVV